MDTERERERRDSLSMPEKKEERKAEEERERERERKEERKKESKISTEWHKGENKENKQMF